MPHPLSLSAPLLHSLNIAVAKAPLRAKPHALERNQVLKCRIPFAMLPSDIANRPMAAWACNQPNRQKPQFPVIQTSF